jgi:hypothetical protein
MPKEPGDQAISQVAFGFGLTLSTFSNIRGRRTIASSEQVIEIREVAKPSFTGNSSVSGIESRYPNPGVHDHPLVGQIRSSGI